MVSVIMCVTCQVCFRMNGYQQETITYLGDGLLISATKKLLANTVTCSDIDLVLLS